MKKIVCFVLCCLLLATCSLAAEYTVTRITVDAVVDESGSCELSQQVELQVSEPVEEILVPVDRQARRAELSGVSGRIVRRDGAVYARLKPGKDFTGSLKATVSYALASSVITGEQGQEFACRLLGDLWDRSVERFSFSVVLPGETAAQPSFFSSYSADDVEDDMTWAVSGRAVSGRVRGGLKDHEAFTMQMTVPEGFFAADGAGQKTRSSAVAAWICGILGTMITAAAAYYWFRFLRSGRLRVQARTLPPEGVTPAEVPYLLCGARPDFALLVCHWGSLGYLTIAANSAGRVLLRKSMAMGTERREEERKLFEMLFDASDVCEAGGSRYQRTAELAEKALRCYWVRRLFDRDSGSPLILRMAATLVSALAMLGTMSTMLPPSGLKWLLLITAFVAGGACGTAVYYGSVQLAVRDWKWVGIGAGALLLQYMMARFGGGLYLMLLALALCVFTGFATRNGGRRTASGSDVVEQTMGFCRFLTHAEDVHLTQQLQQDGQFFYSMMLYAAACGQGRTFARRFEGLQLESCAFLQFSGTVPQQACAYYLRFEQLLRTMRM